MTRWLVGAAVLLFAATVCAASVDAGALYNAVRQAQKQNAQVNKKREQRFAENKARQGKLLRHARAKLRPVQTKTKHLHGEYVSLKAQIKRLKKKLEKETADLKQLKQVIRQAASGLQMQNARALIAGQYPGRASTLQRLTSPRNVLSPDQLNSLWQVLRQNVAQTGRVVTFAAPVTGLDGTTQQKFVTRVGPFAAFTREGEYLSLFPGGGFKQLRRQPAASARHDASHLVQASHGIHHVVIDPQRGGLLAQMQNLNNGWGSTLHSPAVRVMTFLIAGLAVILLIVQLRLFVHTRRQSQVVAQSLAGKVQDNPLERVLLAAHDSWLWTRTRWRDSALRQLPHAVGGRGSSSRGPGLVALALLASLALFWMMLYLLKPALQRVQHDNKITIHLVKPQQNKQTGQKSKPSPSGGGGTSGPPGVPSVPNINVSSAMSIPAPQIQSDMTMPDVKFHADLSGITSMGSKFGGFGGGTGGGNGTGHGSGFGPGSGAGNLGEKLIPLATARPQIPERACNLGIEGYAVAEYTVKPNGRVANIRILDAKPGGIFEQPMIKSLEHWLYQATGGKSYDVVWKFKFRLKDCKLNWNQP